MKKITVIQAGLIAAGALLTGVLIGLLITGVSSSGNFLAGTFAKADKYKKVNMTEKDVILRDGLASDTARLSKNLKYLYYNYYQSLKTQMDINKIIEKTAAEEEFNNTCYVSVNALAMYKNQVIDSARIDILTAINALETLGTDENAPLTEYFTKAQNAITGVQYHDRILIQYLSSIEKYLSGHADKPHQGLKDAYDLLTMNAIVSAIVNQNEPMLKYFEDKKFYNTKQGMTALLAEVQLSSEMNALVAHDAAEISGFSNIDSPKIISGLMKMDATISGESMLSQSGQIDKSNVQRAMDKNYNIDITAIINSQAKTLNNLDALQAVLSGAFQAACGLMCIN